MGVLAEHPNPDVQALVAARLGVKSTIAETRTTAFINMGTRGSAPVYLKYSGAQQTHRFSGGDKVNWQNLGRGSKLRDAVIAPEGMVLVVVDSSNIESRVLDYLAIQEQALEAYRLYDSGQGEDIYCFMASQIYGREIIADEHPDERFLGKVAKLGLGYGMGADKFFGTTMQFGVPGVTPDVAIDAVRVYRRSHDMVVRLWKKADAAIPSILSGMSDCVIDPRGIVKVGKEYVELPGGLRLRYPGLQHDQASGWTFWAGRERVKIYGGKLVENLVQALARCIVMEQTMRLTKKYKLVLSVHDEAVFCVPEALAQQCLADCLAAFRTAPTWARDMPLNAKADIGVRYGDAK
jgi:DNA polymerase